MQDCWWMMDAIMEFTSAGNMPSVFKDNAGPPVEAATVLPARMDNNQLHRYSKVQSVSCISSEMSHLEQRAVQMPVCLLGPKSGKKFCHFIVVVQQISNRLTQADISCTTTAHPRLFFFPKLD